MQNFKKIKRSTNIKQKKQNEIMTNTSDQNSDDEEINVCTTLLLFLAYFH